MRPSASYFLKTLSTECTDPPRAELQMKTTLNQLLKRNKSIQRRNFLEKMMRKGVGTNKAEVSAQKSWLTTAVRKVRSLKNIFRMLLFETS